MRRRTLLKGTMSAGTLLVAAGAGLLSPQSVLAAWPKAAFSAKKIEEAVRTLAGTSEMDTDDTSITLKAPPIAENGAEVGVTVSTSLPNVDAISIFVEKNNSPLTGTFLLRGANPFVRTRIKVGKSSNVVAVVRSNGRLFSTKRMIKVTIGGCGG